jgi:hypothetical protein
MNDLGSGVTVICLATAVCLAGCNGSEVGNGHVDASDGTAGSPAASGGGGGAAGSSAGGAGPSDAGVDRPPDVIGPSSDGATALDAGDAATDAGDAATDAGDAATTPQGDPVNWGPPFVAIGYRSARVYSMDGKTWSQAPDPAVLPPAWTGPPIDGDNQWLLRGGCWGQGKFIAVGGTGGDLGLMLSSSDGKAWSLVGGSQTNDDCAFGAGLWVTQIRSSRDGTTWTKNQQGVSTRRMVYGDGVFVAAGDDAVSFTKDGKTWTKLPITFVGSPTARKGYNRVAFGNHRFVAINSLIVTAPILEWDGASNTSFSEKPKPAELGTAILIDLAYGRHAFYIGSTEAMYRLADGSSQWEKISAPGAANLYNLFVTDDLFFNDQRWSTDGIHWTKATNPPTDDINKIVGTPR